MYRLDSHVNPGVVMVVVDGHPSYTAESFHQAERFAELLLSTEPILLPAPVQMSPLVTRLLEQFADLP